MKTKVCNTCNTEKSLEEFSVNRRNKTDGRKGTCKVCNNEKEKLRSLTWSNNIEKVPDNNTSVVKVCRCCGIKAITQEDLKLFKPRPTRKYGFDSICIECEKTNRRYENLSEKSLNSIKARKYRERLKKYNLTENMYSALVQTAGNKCQICDVSFNKTRVCIDHCHLTGKVRGLLCDSCNTSIGKLGDTSSSVYKAYKYLHSFEVSNVGAGF